MSMRYVSFGIVAICCWLLVAVGCESPVTPDGGTREKTLAERGRETAAEPPVTQDVSQEVPATDPGAREVSPVDAGVDAGQEPAGMDDADAGLNETVVPEAGNDMSSPIDSAPEQGAPEQAPPMAECAPLPAPSGTIVRVTPAQATKLPQIVAQAKAGTTILLADGVYKMTGGEAQRRIQFKQPRVTLRSASGDPTKVIIDGEYKTQEMLFVSADDVTIAEITIRRAKYHHIHITGRSSGHTMRTKMYRLRLIDGGQQFIKVNSCCNRTKWADEGRVECSEFVMTNAGRPNIESRFGGCYTGGVDAHGAKDWVVRLNTFRGIYCTNGSLSEHAIHFWRASRGTLVERNTIINCARGIGFGLTEKPSAADRKYADNPYPNIAAKGHMDGIIRNNVIHADPSVTKYYDTGIELEQAYKAIVVHNTVASKAAFTGLSYRFANTTGVIRNNLLYRLSKRNGARSTVSNNLSSVPANYFVDPSKVDYHLTSSAIKAIGKGMPVPQAGLDRDGNPHNKNKPDLGAYRK